MRKKMIVVVLATLAGVGVGAALGYGPLLRYKSTGVLRMDMGAAEYKRFAELATDSKTVRQFAAMSVSSERDTEWANEMALNLTKADWLTPLPKISKADAKDLPDVMLQQDKSPEVYLGLRLTYTAADPDAAAKGATWLGRYFQDVAAREAVREQVSTWTAENQQFSDRATENKLKFQFGIEQAEARATALKKLVASYPEVMQRDSRQVVDVRKDNEKFMSPLSQLVGAESEIIEIRERSKKLDREIEQQAFAKAMVADAAEALSQSRSGSDSVIKLSEMIVRFSKLVKTDAEREKLSSMAADLSHISARFLSRAQFVAQPSVPTRPERPRPLMVMALLGLLAALASAALMWRKSLIKMLFQNNAESV